MNKFMSLTTLSAAALAGAILSSASAHAFNVKNDTAFTVCVTGNKGHYFDKVMPKTTNQGWAVNEAITLRFAPFDGYVILENNQGHVLCNSYDTTCALPPHGQAVLTDAIFYPGAVDANVDPKAAFTMFYVLDAPARFTVEGCE